MPEHPLRLCEAKQSSLLIVDIQERLAAAMAPGLRDQVVRNAGVLLTVSRLLQVPAFLTEQYPKGLGSTVAALADAAGGAVPCFEKTCFSCCGAGNLMEALHASGRRQVVMAGMEAHVCVLQSAAGLARQGFEVYVAADAIASRAPENLHNAISRFEKAGVVVTNTESVVFEWLRDSRNPHFRTISAMLR